MAQLYQFAPGCLAQTATEAARLTLPNYRRDLPTTATKFRLAGTSILEFDIVRLLGCPT
jgi:hypothetical protein